MENGDAHDARKWGCTLCDLKYRGVEVIVNIR